ncbi:imidazole glycerol phosphate synthase subunit HisH [soil metagenome]
MSRVSVAVLDHGMGNLRSVAKALERAGGDVAVTSDPRRIASSDALCVPGQGIFGRCMGTLASTGLDDVVRAWIGDERPYLGICLGMQVLFDLSEERGERKGLSIVEGRVERLCGPVRVPHIGWNLVNETYFYFDHSFCAHPADDSIVAGWCEHGERFAAWIERGAISAVQFHPEKSAGAGIEVLRRWLETA